METGLGWQNAICQIDRIRGRGKTVISAETQFKCAAQKIDPMTRWNKKRKEKKEGGNPRDNRGGWRGAQPARWRGTSTASVSAQLKQRHCLLNDGERRSTVPSNARVGCPARTPAR